MYLSTLHVSYSRRYTRLSTYTLIFIQEGYIQEGQPQFGQKIKKVIYMMTSLLLNKGLRLNSVSNLLINKKECICPLFSQCTVWNTYGPIAKSEVCLRLARQHHSHDGELGDHHVLPFYCSHFVDSAEVWSQSCSPFE